MNHLTEEELVDAYYGDAGDAGLGHLRDCVECAAAFSQLNETLDAISEFPVPMRSAHYGADVWARVRTRLPEERAGFGWRRRWTVWMPAIAAALVCAFFAGTWSEHRHHTEMDAAVTAKAAERVLLLSIGDHLERSQIVLTELAHADPQKDDVTTERKLAADLVEENRLLRERAARTGDKADAAFLEDLQRVLLDLANSPAGWNSKDLTQVQRRMEEQGLLFKVRVMRVDAEKKGQTL